VRLEPSAAEQPALWLAQFSQGGKWTSRVLPGTTRLLRLDSSPDVLAVSAADRYGALSKPFVRKQEPMKPKQPRDQTGPPLPPGA